MNNPVAEVMARLSYMKRPSLLVTAARAGVMTYNRERSLRRILKTTGTPALLKGLTMLLDEEQIQNDLRRTGSGLYDVSHHIELMIALIADGLTFKEINQ